MKKILFILVSLLSLNCYSQVTFKCDNIVNQLTEWNQISEQFKSKGSKKWAKAASEKFPLNSDGYIEYVNIITIDSIINIDDYEDHICEWIMTEFSNAIPIMDKVNHNIKVQGILRYVGQTTGLFSASTVLTDICISIDIKENRIRIKSYAPHYYLGAVSLGGLNSGAIQINSTYPFNEKSSYKDTYAMAFINVNANIINKNNSFLNFLNRHITDINDDQDDW